MIKHRHNKLFRKNKIIDINRTKIVMNNAKEQNIYVDANIDMKSNVSNKKS